MKYLTILGLLCLVGCERQSSKNFPLHGGYSVRTIDGCEYIEFENSTKVSNTYSYTITHKGNCKNPIHKCN